MVLLISTSRAGIGQTIVKCTVSLHTFHAAVAGECNVEDEEDLQVLQNDVTEALKSNIGENFERRRYVWGASRVDFESTTQAVL